MPVRTAALQPPGRYSPGHIGPAGALPGCWLAASRGQPAPVPAWLAPAAGLLAGASPSPPPAFDCDAIAGLVRYAEAGEAGWRDWFATQSVQPFEITYEDLVKDLDPAVRAIASFLEVPLPPGLGHIRPRMRRQADHHTERLVTLFNRHAGA